MTVETTAKTGELSSIGEVQLGEKNVDINDSHLKTLQDIRNYVEQIHEIGQSLTAVSHEIFDELIKFLQLNNKPIQLDNAEGGELIIHPKGFTLQRNTEGDFAPQRLLDFEPSVLPAILTQLIPKLSTSLAERKRSDEGLLEKLIRVRDSDT